MTKIALLAIGLSFFLPQTTRASDSEREALLIQLDKAHTALLKDATDSEAKLSGAQALEKLNYPYSALTFLKRIGSYPRIEKKSIDRLEQALQTTREKNPTSLLVIEPDLSSLNPAGRSELRYLAAKYQYRQGNWAQVRQTIGTTSSYSPLFLAERLLVASSFVKEGNTAAALGELDQLVAKLPDSDLAAIERARLQYALKKFPEALTSYQSVGKNSPHYSTAQLERSWTLLQLGQFEPASGAAEQAQDSPEPFVRAQAHRAQATALLQLGKVKPARKQIEALNELCDDFQEALEKYEKDMDHDSAPKLIERDKMNYIRISRVQKELQKIQAEIERAKDEDLRDHPVFSFLASSLRDISDAAAQRLGGQVGTYFSKRRALIQELRVQSHLLAGEAFLAEYHVRRQDYVQQQSPKTLEILEQEGSQLLESALTELGEALRSSKSRLLAVEFRQSELFWELGTLQHRRGTRDKDVPLTEKGRLLRQRALASAQVLLDVSQFPKTGQLLFFVGLMRAELGQKLQATPVLQRFVADYKNHPKVPDAELMLGDIAYANSDFGNAVRLYTHVIAVQNSPVRGYALYKLGWSRYHQQNFQQALTHLEEAVQWGNQWQQTEATQNLSKEARRDLLALYAEVGQVKEAQKYFSRFAAQQPEVWLVDLAWQLEKSGQYEKAEELYRILVETNPSNPKNLGFFNSILTGVRTLKQRDKFVAVAKEVTGRFGDQLRSPDSENKQVRTTENIFREALLDGYKQLGESPNKALRDFITALDGLYFQNFDTWPEAQEPLFQRAQLSLNDRDYLKAADHFRLHWSRFNSSLRSEQREESLRLLIHVLDKLEEKQKPKGPGLSQQALELIEFASKYVAEFPQSKHTRATSFLISSLYYKYKETKRGIEISRKLFDFNPSDDFGHRSFQNIKVSYYADKDWETLYRWVSDVAARKMPGIEEYPEITTIKGESLFLWAETTSDDVKAANLFLHLSGQPDLKPLWEKSLYNAFVRFHKAGKFLDALATADRLERYAPLYKELVPLALVRASLYQESGNYEQAIVHLNFYLGNSKGSTPEIQQARLNSALILESIGKKTEAAQRIQEYLASKDSTPSGREDAEKALTRIARLQNRGLASVPKWNELLSYREEFEQNPLPNDPNLASQLKRGAANLEQLARAFLKVSHDPKTPENVAVEASCAVPLLYAAYERTLRTLSFNHSGQIADNLNRLANPLVNKAKDFGVQCITRSLDAEHDGPLYREVNQKWGWEWDPIVSERVRKIVTELEKSFPRLDEPQGKSSEAELFKLHLSGLGTAESWYVLAKQRSDLGQKPLSRLTTSTSLAKYPGSGKLWNLLAVLQWNANETGAISGLLTRAAKSGSSVAVANLALYDLKRGKILTAFDALKEAEKNDLFDENRVLRDLVKEWVKP